MAGAGKNPIKAYALSRQAMLRHGWIVGKAESMVTVPGRRGGRRMTYARDLFGFIDMVCLRENGPMIGIQTTSKGHLSSRMRKAFASEAFKPFQQDGREFHFHGWFRRKSLKTGKVSNWCRVIKYVGGSFLSSADVPSREVCG